ncbi:MAG: hypothetical protein ACI9H9_000288 [Pseudoalteromonas tetraodonis]|jgi:hypothetical protein|uniref:DUF2788 domain-containing protein n=7 Tax=Pseudoalteromonas TaxID=53246 RepID=A0A9W4VMH8_PSEHA|nr:MULTISPECIES: DUF2788 domain-containing protein [Pseudoalteromonas]MAY59340.1 DUF2788 domain-containing protein [Pseudoalteromonas sp.]MDC2855517.1 DUF2788 domain-containing protein [Ningiella sp. W23]ADT68538.1 hypothetical protein PSM_A1610 [Pseudoalteromonas sp. SM9913]ALQ54854.1 Putative membrane protein [Pseudoalteromonas issachenkonii]ATC90676.1 hypothetical protein PISS_a1792 [Pseudoalteromonas issachenkonii]|tara:strand:- start:156 stop:377 length:222 start_codon:yes stop_codon:yes gene_type:complete
MVSQFINEFDTLGLYFGLAGIFIFIGLAIKDVLKSGNVPKFGRYIVWLVLFLGCSGFIAKGLIQVFWQGAGVG